MQFWQSTKLFGADQPEHEDGTSEKPTEEDPEKLNQIIGPEDLLKAFTRVSVHFARSIPVFRLFIAHGIAHEQDVRHTHNARPGSAKSTASKHSDSKVRAYAMGDYVEVANNSMVVCSLVRRVRVRPNQ